MPEGHQTEGVLLYPRPLLAPERLVLGLMQVNWEAPWWRLDGGDTRIGLLLRAFQPECISLARAARLSSALQVRSGARPAIVWLDSIEVGVEGVAGKRERRRQRTLASWRLERMTARWSNESRAEAEEEKDDEEKKRERDFGCFSLFPP